MKIIFNLNTIIFLINFVDNFKTNFAYLSLSLSFNWREKHYYNFYNKLREGEIPTHFPYLFKVEINDSDHRVEKLINH